MNLDLVLIILFGIKAFAIAMFAMNVAVILTWADRRQGAMIQDRVGPNRAVAWIPTKVAQALAVLPALAIVGLIVLAVTQFPPEGIARTNRAMLFSQLAILFTWLTGLVIAGRVRRRGAKNAFDVWIASLGDPRRFFYVGIVAHFLAFLIAAATTGTADFELVQDVGYGGGAGLLIAAILGGAVYAAYSIRNEPRIGLRLAGLLHPAADGLKTIFKEDFIPPNADRLLHSLAPIISFFPALVVLAVVPFGDTLCFGTTPEGNIDLGQLMTFAERTAYVPNQPVCPANTIAVPLQVVDLNVGLLYFFALAGTGIVGAALAGWASDNKYSLLGGLRAASQMVSYEVTMGLTLIGAIMIYGSLQVDEMIRWQSENTWGIFVQPLAFFLFFAAAVAESKRIPFDIPEGESEIVAGYYTEYSGMKFAMFFFAEYIAVVASSALMAALFLGGWALPFVHRDGITIAIGDTVLLNQQVEHGLLVVIGLLGYIFKTIALCWLQLTIRWTLPRFRYDQLMRLGWRILLPTSIVNVLATGLIVLAVGSAGAPVQRGLKQLADLSMALIALGGVVGFIYFIVFLLRPAQKRRLLATTSAKFAAAVGGTRTARMEA